MEDRSKIKVSDVNIASWRPAAYFGSVGGCGWCSIQIIDGQKRLAAGVRWVRRRNPRGGCTGYRLRRRADPGSWTIYPWDGHNSAISDAHWQAGGPGLLWAERVRWRSW